MIRKFLFITFLFLQAINYKTQAQDNMVPGVKSYKIGVFVPLYLDSVFMGDNYRYSKNFPRFILPGLDFIQGAQIALDSMKIPNANIEVAFYDCKSNNENIESLISAKKIEKLDLIIGAVKDEDYYKLANFSLRKRIPFISATFPNDGGIINHPYLVILNSTLKAHCEAIYAYLLQNHGSDKIILCRKQGSQEDRVAGYFRKINEPDGKPILNIQTVNIIDSNFNSVKYKLDSTKKNIIIGASLDEYFAYNLSAEISNLSAAYPTTVIGMPNWEGFKSFRGKNSLSDFPVLFTTPFFNGKGDSRTKMIQNIYLKKYKGVPSDNTYKGFETVYLFTKLITSFPNGFMDHLNDISPKIFNEYNFKPALNSINGNTDYYENKHLNFMKIENGNTSRAW